jgi:hypothetical protein
VQLEPEHFYQAAERVDDVIGNAVASGEARDLFCDQSSGAATRKKNPTSIPERREVLLRAERLRGALRGERLDVEPFVTPCRSYRISFGPWKKPIRWRATSSLDDALTRAMNFVLAN